MNLRRVGSAALVGASMALAAVLPAAHGATPSDYSDAQYRFHDQDNMSRSTWRHAHLFTDPAYEEAFVPVAADTWLQSKGIQAEGGRSGRVYTGAGNALVGGSVGDPRDQNLRPDGVVDQQVFFLARTGAKLTGHVWWNNQISGRAPGIVITTGSIQGHEHMYWWAAKALAARGFEVFTWDVQGQATVKAPATPRATRRRPRTACRRSRTPTSIKARLTRSSSSCRRPRPTTRRTVGRHRTWPRPRRKRPPTGSRSIGSTPSGIISMPLTSASP